MAQHLGRQCVDERLQLCAAFADPLRERRAGDGQASALEDALLSVERQVIEVLGDQHLGQQPGRGDALVDDVRRDRRLQELLAARACPLASHMAFDGEDAWLVIQLLRDVLADPLHLAAARADRALGLVVHLASRQMGWQWLAPGDLLVLRPGGLIELGAGLRDVGVQRLLEQAGLFGAQAGAELLAGGSELHPLEDRELVRELVDLRLLEGDLALPLAEQFTLGRRLGDQYEQRLAQLLRVEVVEVLCGDHGM